MTSRPATLIQLAGVSLSHPPEAKRIASPRINWEIGDGDFWIVTTSRELGLRELVFNASGLQPPAEGCVTILGQDTAAPVHKEWLKERLSVGIVFEDGGRVLSHLTVFESVALPLQYHRNCRLDEVAEEVARLLEATEMVPYAHATPGALTSSWRQRLALTRALALRPKVLFLERPLALLERRHRKWWIDFVGRLHRGEVLKELEAVAMVVVTDDAHPWDELGKQYAVLRHDEWCIAQSLSEIENTEWFHLPEEPL